jgi:hypothetical protein
VLAVIPKLNGMTKEIILPHEILAVIPKLNGMTKEIILPHEILAVTPRQAASQMLNGKTHGRDAKGAMSRMKATRTELYRLRRRLETEKYPRSKHYRRTPNDDRLHNPGDMAERKVGKHTPRSDNTAREHGKIPACFTLLHL